MKRPNILFAIADDASHMGAYRYDFVSTPNFDKLTKGGVLFTNSFTSNPKCAPSRASILTGKHTWQLEEACLHYDPRFLGQGNIFDSYEWKGPLKNTWNTYLKKRNGELKQ